MALCTFEEALLKAVRSLETGHAYRNENAEQLTDAWIEKRIKKQETSVYSSSEKHFVVVYQLRKFMSGLQSIYSS